MNFMDLKTILLQNDSATCMYISDQCNKDRLE
jgi:hypothetical protein